MFTGLFHLWTHNLSWAQGGDSHIMMWMDCRVFSDEKNWEVFFFFFFLPWELHCWYCAFPCIKSSFLICFGRPLASIDFDYLWLYLCAPEWSNVISKKSFVEEIVWLLGNCWVCLTLLLRSHELSVSVIGRLLLANRNWRMEAAGPLTMKIWSQERLYYQEIWRWLEEFYQKVDLVRLSWYDIQIKTILFINSTTGIETTNLQYLQTIYVYEDKNKMSFFFKNLPFTATLKSDVANIITDVWLEIVN